MQWYAFVDQPLTLGCAHLNFFYIEINNAHIVLLGTHVFSFHPAQLHALAPVRMVAFVQEWTPALVLQDGQEHCVKQVCYL